MRPGCYERMARVEKSPNYKASVRTVGPCAQRRVTLMPRAIDALSKDWPGSAAYFEGPANRQGLFFVIPVSRVVR